MSQPAVKTKQKKDARDIRAEAQKIANSVKMEGQTPIETKAIANGIQRGMEMFLRQQSEKVRDLDKRSKKVKQLANQLAQPVQANEVEEKVDTHKQPLLPWMLLGISWLLFALAIILIKR
ncbi:MAG TPA: DUF2956 family protein [Cellvibrio sp.]|nr:DUF2956 family protein [Cellvibrio sp.]